MELQLTDKVAFVAGSSRGIGRAIAHGFLAEGARVVVTGRNAEILDATTIAFTSEFGAEQLLSSVSDLTRPKDIQRVLKQVHARWGMVDCLVANIGSGTARAGWQLSDSDWEAMFEINLWASVRLVEAMLPDMVAAQQGNIIFISSIAGYESLGAPLTYGAAKAALIHYANDLARQVGPDGVRVNCVAPGNILFPGGSWEKRLTERREQTESTIKAKVPLQRFGTPEEIADLVLFLASERAAFITGACFVADGGQTRSS